MTFDSLDRNHRANAVPDSIRMDRAEYSYAHVVRKPVRRKNHLGYSLNDDVLRLETRKNDLVAFQIHPVPESIDTPERHYPTFVYIDQVFLVIKAWDPT